MNIIDIRSIWTRRLISMNYKMNFLIITISNSILFPKTSIGNFLTNFISTSTLSNLSIRQKTATRKLEFPNIQHSTR